MDPEAFLDLANQVAKLKMYPYFDIAHAVVCCLALKEDMGSGKIGILFMHWDRFVTHWGQKAYFLSRNYLVFDISIL